MTPESRAENARTMWTRRLGTDRVTADQRMLLARLRRNTTATARVRRDLDGCHLGRGKRTADAILALVGSEEIVVTSTTRGARLTEYTYQRGPKYRD